MAKRKLTLDFFLHDAHASSNIKIKLLEKRHNCEGYAVFFKLLERLCQVNGMKLDLSPYGVIEILADEFRLRDAAHLTAIIQTCVEVGLLDRQLWESERVVFSGGLYQRYVARLEDRRKDAERKRDKRLEKSLSERISQIQTSDPDPEIKDQRSNTDTNTEQSRNVRPDIPGQGEGKRGFSGCFSEQNQPIQPFGQIPAWRNDNSPNGLKPEFVTYIRDVYFPTLPEFKDGKSKPDTLRARNWITIRERSHNPDHQVLLNVFAAWQEAQPEPDRQEERDRAWLEEARIMGNRFYETADSRIDPDRWNFYKANKHLIFPEEVING